MARVFRQYFQRREFPLNKRAENYCHFFDQEPDIRANGLRLGSMNRLLHFSTSIAEPASLP